MIVPDHWAEARVQHRARGRQVTVRRHGWSMRSEADALDMAQARADSVPMLVITGVNAQPTLGKGLGYLHELPDQRGMTDLVVDYETTRPDLRPYSEEMMGGAPEDQPQRYRDRSPIHFVHNIRGRLLIVQGMRDPNVTPDNVHAVRRALEAAGVDYEVLAFDDEGHGIVKPANQRRLYQKLARFFAEAFMGSPLVA